MIPHEKALVERLKNEPFALIGINTDKDKASYRKEAAANGVTWRSAWEGSTRGPLCSAWGIQSFPTIYVLDAKGTIRHTGLRGPQLEQAVQVLIREAKASAVDPAGNGPDAGNGSRAGTKGTNDPKAPSPAEDPDAKAGRGANPAPESP